MAEKTKGKCKYCGREYAKAYMYRHLKACKKRAEELEKEKKTPSVGYFILEVTDKYENDHWLMVEITEEATLRVLDDFLRDIWLECCGHLSSFTINGISYEECPDDDFDWGPPSRSTNIKLKKVLREGITIKYDYDFGSTTSLVIKVKERRTGGKRKEKITLLSRNNPIEYTCHTCGKAPAKYICSECLYGGETFLFCDDCVKEHMDHDYALLPVCNSPRMGVCAYSGSEKYPDQFEPDV